MGFTSDVDGKHSRTANYSDVSTWVCEATYLPGGQIARGQKFAMNFASKMAGSTQEASGPTRMTSNPGGYGGQIGFKKCLLFQHEPGD